MTIGTTEPGDYTAWRARFGNSGSASGATANSLPATEGVPEPASLVLLVHRRPRSSGAEAIKDGSTATNPTSRLFGSGSARNRVAGAKPATPQMPRILMEVLVYLGLKTSPPNATMSGFPAANRLAPGCLPAHQTFSRIELPWPNYLHVEKRKSFGKRNNERLRRAGRLPAVLYGHGEEAVSLTLAADQFEASLRHGAKVVDLDGDASGKALLQDVQWDTFFQQVLHVDLLRVRAGEKVTIEVPIELRGESPGVRDGGIIEQVDPLDRNRSRRST